MDRRTSRVNAMILHIQDLSPDFRAGRIATLIKDLHECADTVDRLTEEIEQLTNARPLDRDLIRSKKRERANLYVYVCNVEASLFALTAETSEDYLSAINRLFAFIYSMTGDEKVNQQKEIYLALSERLFPPPRDEAQL